MLRYAWILDDAFVYYRYVDNLLFLKLGLVYNQGEYVEGYSSPLWTLLLIPLRAAGLDYWTMTKLVAVASFVLFWGLVARLNRRLAPQGPIVGVPLAFLCFSYGTLCYFTSGIEAPLVQISAVLYALLVVTPGSRALQILVGLTPLVRYEHAVPFAAVLLWAWWRRRRFPVWLVATAALTMGPWLVFKIWYYAELLPNTFYLKNDTNVAQGFRYLWQTIATYQTLPLLALAAAGAWWIRRTGAELRNAERAMMALLALTVVAHVVKIGGDPRHHRYLAFPFVLAICATGGIAETLLASVAPRLRRPLAWAASLAVAGLSFALYPPQLDRHPVTGAESHRPVAGIEDASWHRHLKDLAFDPRRGREDRERRRAYRDLGSRFRYRGVVTVSMCVDAYRMFDRRVVQNFGLTDAFLARTNARADHAAHKFSLRPRARDLAELLRAQTELRPELYREAVQAGQAPAWIAENIDAIELVARKAYNRHAWRENLRLALTFPEQIRIPDWRDDPESDLNPAGPRSVGD